MSRAGRQRQGSEGRNASGHWHLKFNYGKTCLFQQEDEQQSPWCMIALFPQNTRLARANLLFGMWGMLPFFSTSSGAVQETM